jgi:hypothetical protein
MGTLEHWHYDTFKVGPDAPGMPGTSGLLADSPVTFVLNARGKVASLEIEDLDVFKRLPDAPEKEKKN